jgi:tripartite-type tricarboxylate transporter receptor subunit TctC
MLLSVHRNQPGAGSSWLGRAAREAVASPAVKGALGKLAMPLQASSPAERQAPLTSEIKRWGEVNRAAKIEPE